MKKRLISNGEALKLSSHVTDVDIQSVTDLYKIYQEKTGFFYEPVWDVMKLLLMTYNAGKVQGIREERAKRKAKTLHNEPSSFPIGVNATNEEQGILKLFECWQDAINEKEPGTISRLDRASKVLESFYTSKGLELPASEVDKFKSFDAGMHYANTHCIRIFFDKDWYEHEVAAVENNG